MLRVKNWIFVELIHECPAVYCAAVGGLDMVDAILVVPMRDTVEVCLFLTASVPSLNDYTHKRYKIHHFNKKDGIILAPYVLQEKF